MGQRGEMSPIKKTIQSKLGDSCTEVTLARTGSRIWHAGGKKKRERCTLTDTEELGGDKENLRLVSKGSRRKHVAKSQIHRREERNHNFSLGGIDIVTNNSSSPCQREKEERYPLSHTAG